MEGAGFAARLVMGRVPIGVHSLRAARLDLPGYRAALSLALLRGAYRALRHMEYSVSNV